jgi:DNA-binding MarR family transcriptional regulator
MSGETKLDTAEAIRIAAFRAVIRSFLRTSERLAKEANLTPRRYLLLLMIKGAPDGSEQSTVTDLAARLQLAQSTVTELVGRAERAGLLERERSEKDLRVAHLRLTDEGERRLALAARSLAEQRHDLRRRLEELDDD